MMNRIAISKWKFQDELTNDVALAITDFATDETLVEKTKIWDNQITYLLSVIGA